MYPPSPSFLPFFSPFLLRGTTFTTKNTMNRKTCVRCAFVRLDMLCRQRFWALGSRVDDNNNDNARRKEGASQVRDVYIPPLLLWFSYLHSMRYRGRTAKLVGIETIWEFAVAGSDIHCRGVFCVSGDDGRDKRGDKGGECVVLPPTYLVISEENCISTPSSLAPLVFFSFSNN